MGLTMLFGLIGQWDEVSDVLVVDQMYPPTIAEQLRGRDVVAVTASSELARCLTRPCSPRLSWNIGPL